MTLQGFEPAIHVRQVAEWFAGAAGFFQEFCGFGCCVFSWNEAEEGAVAQARLYERFAPAEFGGGGGEAAAGMIEILAVMIQNGEARGFVPGVLEP